MKIKWVPIKVEAAVSTTRPVFVLLGEDVSKLNQLMDRDAEHAFSIADDVLAQAKK